MNGNDIASKLKATIRILFVFGLVIVLIIFIRPNSQDPLFGTALLTALYKLFTLLTESSYRDFWCSVGLYAAAILLHMAELEG